MAIKMTPMAKVHAAVRFLVTALPILAFTAACGGSGAASRVAPASDSTWMAIAPGVGVGGYTLAANGTLSWRGRELLPSLPTRTADGTSSPVAYRISPASPSGRWALAQGSGPTFASVYVLDLERGTTRETPVTKYGIEPWVAWAPRLPAAVVSNRIEGTRMLYRVDLLTGEARHIEFGRALRPPLSAMPAVSTLRWLDAEGSAFSVDARVACNSAVERCDAAPAPETRRFRVNLRTLLVSETPKAAGSR
jgi:hypothetical protein